MNISSILLFYIHFWMQVPATVLVHVHALTGIHVHVHAFPALNICTYDKTDF